MGRHGPKKTKEIKPSTKEKLKQIKKERKQKLKVKRARLIIRNLPFEATEENLKKHFETFGEVEDVSILKKEDGKLRGCGFVQYKMVQKAAKAKHYLNGKPFLGRDISVDFALAKDKFKSDKVEVKQEKEVEVKEEPVDSAEIPEVKDEENDVCEETVVIEDNQEEASDKDGDSEEESDDEDEMTEEIETNTEKKPRVVSNDVVEGKTVFIKNVPFSATNEDLKECITQFGPVYYALICIDKFTEHSKGTAFVKFVNTEDAGKALAAGTELTLFGNVLDCHKALGRDEVQHKAKVQKEEKAAPKDSRNLYLVKEGVILAGSKAAEGVSGTDMAKRLQLEQYKTQMLRNLNMFISRERLVIHNLPPNWDDKKLRQLIQNHSPKNAIIREARIMRDLKNVDAKGVGRSKEFGFVSFAKHEDALTALRALNNNPDIFSINKRPIVAFSIENRAMIKARLKRMEKSKTLNPKCKDFNPKIHANENKKQDDEAAFVGVAAKPGVQKMRSRYNLKTQAKLHRENLKKEKRKAKFAKKPFLEKKQDFTKQPKQKIKKKKVDDNFAKLVTDYKKKLVGPAAVKKSKWYE